MKFATWNQNKRKEADAILWGNLERVDLDLDEIQSTQVEDVVEHKARLAYQITGEPVLVEDAGLRFEARNALPWALIKRFMKEVGTQGLLDQLSIFKNRNAEALCCVGFFDGETVHKFIGKVKWTISETPRWETNFWWDPIFIPNGSEKTFWEMNPEEKMRWVTENWLENKLKYFLIRIINHKEFLAKQFPWSY